MHRHHKKLRKFSVPRQSTYNCKYCNYMRYLSAPTDLSWRCCKPYGGVTATPFRVLLRVYQNAEPCTARTLCMLKFRAIARRLMMFQAIPHWQLKMPLRWYVAIGDSTACTMAFFIKTDWLIQFVHKQFYQRKKHHLIDVLIILISSAF